MRAAKGVDDFLGMQRSLREVEAECVALICCETLELPGAQFCRGYIQNWNQEGEAVPEQSAQKIFRAADLILKAGRPEEGRASRQTLPSTASPLFVPYCVFCGYSSSRRNPTQVSVLSLAWPCRLRYAR